MCDAFYVADPSSMQSASYKKRSQPLLQKTLAWENSWHFARSPLEPLQNDVWVMSAEIPYWWRVTTQI